MLNIVCVYCTTTLHALNQILRVKFIWSKGVEANLSCLITPLCRMGRIKFEKKGENKRIKRRTESRNHGNSNRLMIPITLRK